MGASANQRRIVGLELTDNVAALKVAVDAVSTEVLGWELKGVDGDLPTGLEVKAQLVAYNAITRPTNALTNDLAAIMAETE